MITRDVNEVARELTNLLIEKIFYICKDREEETIDLSLEIDGYFYDYLQVYFPYDDVEYENDDDYFADMTIEVEFSYLDREDGEIYNLSKNIKTDISLSALLGIYNAIK